MKRADCCSSGEARRCAMVAVFEEFGAPFTFFLLVLHHHIIIYNNNIIILLLL